MKSEVRNANTYHVRTARHAERFASSVTFDGWDVQYTQMSAGIYEGESRELNLGGLQIYAESWNTKAHHSGAAWRNSYVFGIPYDALGEGRFNGQCWNREIAAFRGEAAYDALVPPMKLLVICVSRDDFAEYLASVEHLPPPDWLAKGTRLIHSPARASIAAATFLRLIGECCNNAALLAHPDMQASIRQTTMQTLAPLVVDHAISPPSSYGAFSRTQIVRRAREFILSRIDEPLQIMDICRALGVSRRVLQYSFQDVLDTNPVAYLRLLRLNGARRDLLGAGTRAQSVQDVQARWGFWHGSRFSAEYKRMYGELPSETLRRAWQPASYD